MTQKIIRVGSSAAVTIPKDFLKKTRLSIGDKVEVSLDKKRERFLIERAEKVRPELISWTYSFIKKYRPALDELKNK